MKINRKAENKLTFLITAGLIFLALTIALSIGGQVLSQMKDNLRGGYLTGSKGGVNTTYTISETAYTNFQDQNLINSSIRIYGVDGDGDSVILNNNGSIYTIDIVAGRVLALTGRTTTWGTAWNISYDWNYYDQTTPVNITKQGIFAVTNLAQWIPILAIVIAAIVIIGMLAFNFINKRNP